MNKEPLTFQAVLLRSGTMDAAYVEVPVDLREAYGVGRLAVHATFDGVPYDGSLVNMGLKNEDGSVCYVIGVLKTIRKKLNKTDGDKIHVVITER